MPVTIEPYDPAHCKALLNLTLRAWAPVLDQTAQEVPRFTFDAFYPQGWRKRQFAEVAALLDTEPEAIWIAMQGGSPVGFLGLRHHPEDQMGEVYILAVDPAHQRQGIARQLLVFADTQFRAAGHKMVMVETIGDTAHAPARHTYEAHGFQPWPVARYFKEL